MAVEDVRVVLIAAGGVVTGILTALGGVKYFRVRWGHSLRVKQLERQEVLDDRAFFGQYYQQTILDMREEVRLLKASYADVVAKDLQKALEIHQLRMRVAQLESELSETQAALGVAGKPNGDEHAGAGT